MLKLEEKTSHSSATVAVDAGHSSDSSLARARVRAAEPAGDDSATLARSLAGGLSQILSSQALLVVTGVLSLPMLARNFGPEAYGAFSLYVTVLGVVSNLDFARPILVREYAVAAVRGEPTELASLARASAWFLASVALVGGTLALGAFPASVMALSVWIHGRSAPAFAELSARNRVGVATAVRSLGWTVAALATVALSFSFADAHAYVWCFLAANVAIHALLSSLARKRRVDRGAKASAGASLARYRREILDLLGFNLASGVVASADRVLLQRFAPAAVAGVYIANTDLAVKVNMLGTACGNVIYPMASRDVAERASDDAARRFVRVAGWIACGFFALLATLMAFDRPLVALILGPAFTEHRWIFDLSLFGVFVHLWGFLLTPWQRARGDFATQRRAYYVAAAVMLAVGVIAIPQLGLLGAVLAYFAARTAEILLFAREVASMPRSVLPAWKLAALFAMVASLAALASFKAIGATS